MMQEGKIEKMKVSIRKFGKQDIPNKVKWINDPENNTYLHYELPLEIKKTEIWFDNNQDRKDRYDAIIEVDDVPVGVIGLLSISQGKTEYYITLGEKEYKGKGIAIEASKLLIAYAKNVLGVELIYLYTETENIGAQKLFEKLGFIRKGIERNSASNQGRLVDRFYYELVI